MMPPDPYQYPYPYPPPPGGPPPRRRSQADIAATAVFGALAGIAAVAGLWFSLLFPMGTDSCHYRSCSGGNLVLAYVATWGGIALAFLAALVGGMSAARRRSVMWIWPALALVMVVAGVVAGAFLADSVTRPGRY